MCGLTQGGHRRESARVVLCYGDSNTWGLDPATQRRFPREFRWPGRLHAALGDSWQIIEEGLNGRTTALDSVLLPGRNGLEYLEPCLDSHAPVDVVLVYLGTSDLADRYAMTATDIARAAGRLATLVAQSAAGVDGRAPRPILVCPPPLGDTTWNDDWAGAPGKAVILANRFQAVAARLEVDLIDLGEVTRYSAVDGIHLDADGHAAAAKMIERTLRELFPTTAARNG